MSPVLPSHSNDLHSAASTASPHEDEKARREQPSVIAPGNLAGRNHLIAMLGEFVGTTMFLLFSLGGTSVALQAANSVTGNLNDAGAAQANSDNLLYIALVFGVSLGACVWCFFRVSGGLFNPAVTVAFMAIQGITPVRGVLLIIAQFCGGLAGAGLADGLTPGPLFAATTLGGGASIVQGLFIEVFMTSMLVFTILMTAVEKNRATFVAPIAIGMSFFICEAFSVYYTGGSLNPARSLGPATVNKSFPGYFWIYFVGPVLGSLLAVAFYKLLKYLNYETNLGPDCDDDGHSWHHSADMRGRLDRIENLLARTAETRTV
jgi:aquaporin related protein